MATGGKSSGRENGSDRPKPLPWVATGCRRDGMVRRGSTVRVRQRALKDLPLAIFMLLVLDCGQGEGQTSREMWRFAGLSLSSWRVRTSEVAPRSHVIQPRPTAGAQDFGGPERRERSQRLGRMNGVSSSIVTSALPCLALLCAAARARAGRRRTSLESCL
jgi:hypothetical protein